jgi:hypothetical protein
MLQVLQHPYHSYLDSKKRKMRKYLLQSLILHALLLLFISQKPIQQIFKHKLILPDLAQSSTYTLQIMIDQDPVPSPQERQFIYTDASNAEESEVLNAPFESAHNTRLSTVENPTDNSNSSLPQQTGDPNMGLSISKEEGMTNIPTSQQQPQTQPSPTPSFPTSNQPVTLNQPDLTTSTPQDEQEELIVKSEIDEGTLIEEREAMRRASKREALRQAQAQKITQENPQPNEQETLPERFAQPKQSNSQRTRPVEEARSVPTIARARSNIQGGGERGDTTSIASRATPVGRYKSKLYREVGSRWNQEIDRRGGPSTLPLGSVRIAFTVKHTGEITDIRVVSRSASNNIVALENLCLYAIRATSPFEPFDKDVREQLGDSYREEFTFTIYR